MEAHQEVGDAKATYDGEHHSNVVGHHREHAKVGAEHSHDQYNSLAASHLSLLRLAFAHLSGRPLIIATLNNAQCLSREANDESDKNHTEVASSAVNVESFEQELNLARLVKVHRHHHHVHSSVHVVHVTSHFMLTVVHVYIAHCLMVNYYFLIYIN